MTGDEPIPPTISWRGDHVQLIDQRRLPHELVMLDVYSVAELCDLISTLAVRGAPALGAAGAMGVALARVNNESIDAAAVVLIATRPTATNLAWGVERARAAADPIAEAVRVAEEDVDANRRLGAHGSALIDDGARVLTHCNAGALACVGYGTALGVIRAAHEAGKKLAVWVDETRPVLQGSRLTAWELDRLDIPCTVVPDSLAGSLMAGGEVDAIVVGADRIAANGDVANKVGTYPLAVLADYHGVPFYVAAPTSTYDAQTATGQDISIERRSGDEVVEFDGHRVAPVGVGAENRAFDVTPAALVTAYITEDGVTPRS
jgi:methylthioribose-1-phosphate isomerase